MNLYIEISSRLSEALSGTKQSVAAFKDIATSLSRINNQQALMAKGIADIQAGIVKARELASAERQEVMELQQKQTEEIAKLREAIEAQNQPAIDAALAEVESLQTDITGVYEKPQEPIEEEEPEEEDGEISGT